MKTILKPAMAAGLFLTAGIAPVALPSAAAQTVQGIGVVNIEAVVVNSSAYQTAQEQRQTTYQAQIEQANTRRQAIEAQIQPLVQQLQTASQQENADQQALQQQAAQIQQIETSGQRELQQILAPVMLSQAYVEEQINDQLVTAIQNAAQKQNVTLVVSPDSILYADSGYNLNQAVLDELNTLLPTAQVAPPQGWLPRQLREQQTAAQEAAPAAVQPEVETATTPVQGR